MKNENYITIQGWMVNELKLTGNDLICYALIYGFTQNGDYWEKSAKYISDWVGVSHRAVVDILNRLIDRGLLDKQDYTINGVKFCKYKATVPNFTTYEESSLPPYEETAQCQNNIDNNKEEKKENIKRKKECAEPTEDEHKTFEEFRKAYKGKKRGHDTEFNFFISQNKDWRNILPLLGYAIEKENTLREQARLMNKFFPEQKNMQTYLNGKNRAWEVYTSDIEHYDASEYRPICDGVSLMWNDHAKCYMTPFEIYSIADGYTNKDRPNGAVVMWRGYKYIWNGENKEWIKE